MPLLPVEQPGKPASADWLSTYKPTFNDAQEPAREPDEPAADGAHDAAGGESDTVESDTVAAVDDGQSGQGGGADRQDGDTDDGDNQGGHSQGGSSEQGDSRGDQQGERGGGERGGGGGGERHRELERPVGQNAAQPTHRTGAAQNRDRQDEREQGDGLPAIRTARNVSSPDDGGDDGASGGNRFLSNGPQMERPGTRTPTEWLSDPASGALRAAVVAAGQRIVAERASTPRRVGATQQTHEAEQAGRLTLARRVREAEAFIQQRDHTAQDGSQETD